MSYLRDRNDALDNDNDDEYHSSSHNSNDFLVYDNNKIAHYFSINSQQQ